MFFIFSLAVGVAYFILAFSANQLSVVSKQTLVSLYSSQV